MPEQIELIDKKALIKDIADGIRLADEWEKESYEKKDECGLKHAVATRQSLLAMIERVKEAPTIEAEPVRHGRWIEESTNEYYCSYCGKYAPIEKNMRHSDCSNWCKECGARMNSTNTNVGGKGGADNDS